MSAWLKTHNLDGEDKMLARRIIFDDARKSRAILMVGKYRLCKWPKEYPAWWKFAASTHIIHC